MPNVIGIEKSEMPSTSTKTHTHTCTHMHTHTLMEIGTEEAAAANTSPATAQKDRTSAGQRKKEERNSRVTSALALLVHFGDTVTHDIIMTSLRVE